MKKERSMAKANRTRRSSRYGIGLEKASVIEQA
jgi:3-deoxy-D-manno-octulosonic acid (KDO) 8-phosphate synthase